jgi:5-methylcytosine-specific restriction enzyme B
MTWVADVVDEANRRLEDRNAAIGPSHFMRRNLTEVWVHRIWNHSVLPYVEEHYFGQPERLADFELNTLRAAAASGAADIEAGEET